MSNTNTNVGSDNSVLGSWALSSATNDTSCNSAFGSNSLLKHTKGSFNTSLGAGAMTFNITGNRNVAVGSSALEFNTNSENNTAIGTQALFGPCDGSNNTAIGFLAGANDASGSYNTYLGANTGTTLSQSLISYTNSTAIGYGAIVNYSNQIVLGTNTEFVCIPSNRGLSIGKTTAPTPYALDVNGTINFTGEIYKNGAPFSNNLVNGNLFVSNDISGNGNLFVAKDISGNGNLFVAKDISGNSNLFVSNDISGNGNLFVAKDISGNSNLFVAKDISGNGNLYISGQMKINQGVFAYDYNGYNVSLFSIIPNPYSVGDNLGYKVKTGYNPTTTTGEPLTSNNFGNTAIGAASLNGNTTGSGNTAIGARSLFNNTSGYYNTSIGGDSLFNNTSGNHNVSIGIGSLYKHVSGDDNTSIGDNAGNSDISGKKNTFIGSYADISSNYVIQNSTAIGYNAKIDASNQIVLGTSGEFVCIPSNRGLSIGKTTAPTTALDVSGSIIVSGDYKSDVSFNTKIGTYALTTNETGSDNTAVGKTSLYRNTTGYSNTAVGNLSLWGNTTGAKNTAIGFEAGRTNDTLNNTFLGAYTDISSNATNITNSTALGYNAKIDVSNQIVLGTSTEFVCIPSNIGLSIGKATAPTSNYALDVSGSINFSGEIYKNGVSGSGSSSNSIIGNLSVSGDISGNGNLSVRGSVEAASYNATSDYRIKDNVRNLDEQDNISNLRPVKYFNKQTNKNDFGLIAHELQTEYPDLVSGEKDGQELQSVNYIGLISVLIKEVQELKCITAEQAIEIAELKSTFLKG